MAIRSVIEIDVQDAAFRRFQEQYKRYQEMLKTTPASWEQAKKSIDGTTKSFKDLVTAAAVRQTHAKLISDAEKEAARQLERQSRTWRDMARSTQSVAGNIINATRSLLRWASLTGLFSGLIGAGGLFGIERLAMSGSDMRRSALGLGVTSGQNRAFALNYSRVVNAEGMLSGVNEALLDPRKRVGLYAAGLSEADIRGKNAAQVSVELIEKIKKLADATDPRLLGSVFEARHLGQFMTLEDFQRLRNTSPSELRGYRTGYERDSTTTGAQDAILRQWQDLSVGLARSWQKIESSLLKGLVSLAPNINALSESVSKAVTEFMADPHLGEWIELLGKGIREFAEYIRTPAFTQSIHDFTDGVAKMAAVIQSFTKWFTGDSKLPLAVPGATATSPKIPGGVDVGGNPVLPPELLYDPNTAALAAKKFWEWLKEHIPGTGASGALTPLPMSYTVAPGGGRVWNTLYRPNMGGETPYVNFPRSGPSPGGDKAAYLTALEAQGGLPPGTLDSIWAAESRRGLNLGPSTAGAEGDFQFIKKTWRAFGGGPMNFWTSAQKAGAYLQKLLGMFGGDIAKAVASYNWGEGNVQADVARWGGDWMKHLPPETANYLRKVLPGIGGVNPPSTRHAMNVRVHNATGGSAIVMASQLPA